MRTAAWTSAALSSLVLIAGCASGPKIIVDKDPGVDMTAFKTFGYFDQVATDRAQ